MRGVGRADCDVAVPLCTRIARLESGAVPVSVADIDGTAVGAHGRSLVHRAAVASRAAARIAGRTATMELWQTGHLSY